VSDVYMPEPVKGSNVFMSTGLRWLWLVIVVFVVDQLSKHLVIANLALYEPVSVMPSLNLTYAENRGAAFSFLSSASGWQRWFFIALALGVSTVLFVWLSRLAASQRLQACALALILGGALGNLWDRMAYGYVIDFIDVYYAAWHFPVFNVADSAITIGAILLILDTLLESRSSASTHREE